MEHRRNASTNAALASWELLGGATTHDTRDARTIPSQSETSPRLATLNIEQYPSILDRILASANRHTLVALRAVSRRLCHECDSHIARHIVIKHQRRGPSADGTGAATFILTSREGKIPLARNWSPAELLLSSRALVEVINSLHDTKVIDIVGPVMDKRVGEIFSAFHNKVILRLRANRYGVCPLVTAEWMYDEWDQSTLYAFICSRVNKVIIFCHQWDVVAHKIPHPEPAVVSHTEGIKKLVFNVSFDPHSTYAPQEVVDAEYPPTVEEVVFLHRAVPGLVPPGNYCVRTSLEDIQALFDVLLDNIAFFIGADVKHILVNVGDLNPLWIGAAPVSSDHERVGLIRDKVRSDLRYRFPNKSPAQIEDILARNLLFPTWKEYQATMALEEFYLEAEV